jgi:hypothetical protein
MPAGNSGEKRRRREGRKRAKECAKTASAWRRKLAQRRLNHRETNACLGLRHDLAYLSEGPDHDSLLIAVHQLQKRLIGPRTVRPRSNRSFI